MVVASKYKLMYESIPFNIAKVQQRIADAEKKYHRKPNSVQLVAASKTRSAATIRQTAAHGLRHFGENYVQEALEKQQQLNDLDLTWHFIGPIQANKTKAIAEHFDWVHSVDRIKVAQRLNDQRPDSLQPLNICLQINISEEASKSGASLEELSDLLDAATKLPRLCVRGVMAIPQASKDFEQQCAAYAKVKNAVAKMKHSCDTIDTLSIGMSNDMEAAIAEGSTIVRIGTDIFGPRD